MGLHSLAVPISKSSKNAAPLTALHESAKMLVRNECDDLTRLKTDVAGDETIFPAFLFKVNNG